MSYFLLSNHIVRSFSFLIDVFGFSSDNSLLSRAPPTFMRIVNKLPSLQRLDGDNK